MLLSLSKKVQFIMFSLRSLLFNKANQYMLNVYF